VLHIAQNEDVGGFVAGCVKEIRQGSSNDDKNDDKFPWGEVLVWVGDKLLTTCLDTGSRDNMSVLIVAFPASGMAFTPPLSTPLLESAASKKEGANNIAMVDGVIRALAYE
jgi:hypothetical protein